LRDDNRGLFTAFAALATLTSRLGAALGAFIREQEYCFGELDTGLRGRSSGWRARAARCWCASWRSA